MKAQHNKTRLASEEVTVDTSASNKSHTRTIGLRARHASAKTTSFIPFDLTLKRVREQLEKGERET